MARNPRIVFPGSLHHITARGVARRALFADDNDREWFLSLLAGVVRLNDWTCHSYCLMGNHFHLVVRTGEFGLAAGMHRLNALHAQRYNRLFGVKGHVFDSRYANQLVTEHQHELELARYVPLNPVRAGLCRRPSEWPWSSYRDIAGLEPARLPTSPLATLELFGRDVDAARGAYVEWVEEGIAAPTPRLGEVRRPALLELIRTLGVDGGVLAFTKYGYRQPEIAAALGLSVATLQRRLAAVRESAPGPNSLTRTEARPRPAGAVGHPTK